MASSIGFIGSALAPSATAALARANALRYASDGSDGQLDEFGSSGFDVSGLARGIAGVKAGAVADTRGSTFETALLKAMDGVSASQGRSDNLLQKIVASPNSVDAQDVTIAMAEANMSLNLAKTLLSRIVRAWKDVINTR